MTTIDGSAIAAERDRLQQAVTNLTTERDQLAQGMRNLSAEVQNLQQRIMIIAENLLQEANDRNFCADYDHFVERVNGIIGADVLLKRARDWYVSFSGSMTVHANGEDEALELCGSMLGRMEGRCDYSMSWDLGEAEVVE